MADNQEKSDDLIAELAKLMASNAQGSENESKPGVIKLTPLGETTAAAGSTPLRIPGMEAPKPAAPTTVAAAPAGSVRIPGMDAPSSAAPPAPTAAPAPQGQPGAAPATAPLVTPPASQPSPSPAAPPPMSPKPDAARPGPSPVTAPAAQAAAAFAQPRSTSSTPFAAGLRPTAAPPPAPAVAAKPEAAPLSTSGNDDSFDFDFGFGDPGAPQRDPVPETSIPQQEADALGDDAGSSDEPDEEAVASEADDDDDPIADLIKAELVAPQDSGVPAAPRGDRPASVEAVPARDFGHGAIQAPVLIGHPGRAAQPAPVQAESGLQGSAQQDSTGSGDSFSVAPVFGLGSAQRPEAPADRDSDPMAEIESLIGEAVRAQVPEAGQPEQQQDQAPRQAQQPPPVVPPLTTGFAPRRAGLKDVESRAQSAEAAILAAAAATGAEVGRVEPPVDADEGPYRRSRVKPPNTRSFGGLRQYLGMGVAAVLLLAAGLGLYWVLGLGRGDPDNAPVLTADTSPVKEAPAAAADTAETPRSVVFDEIDGVAGDDAAETLVSRDETADTPIAEVARVSEPEVTETGLANRRVRTVTVRPDGTIVSADEAVAGSEALPVDRPNVPELPGLTGQPNELLTAAGEAPLVAPSQSEAATGSSAAAEDPIAALVAGTATATGAAPLPEVGADGETTELAALDREPETPVVFDGGLAAPMPMPRPSDRSSLTGAGEASASATTANAPASLPLVSLTGDAPAAAASAPAVDANAYVQLASLPSEGEARSQVSAMQSRWGNLFGGQSLVVQRAELGGGRVTYRLRLPANSLQDATRICASIKANGGDCFATNG